MIYTSREVYEYISRQTNDPIVEWKTCAVSGTQFPIFQSDLDFYTKISPTFAGQKFQIPTPTLCPEERQRRRLSFRNERKLYRRQCDASKKSIISIYSPDKPYKVYDQKIWRSDAWDPMEYGMDFDFSKTFTENFRELQYKVPRCSILNGFNENCEYNNHGWKSKDCYMCTGFGNLEHCFYCHDVEDNKDCMDMLSTFGSTNSYECLDSNKILQSNHIINSENISFSGYINDCRNLEYSLFCSNCDNKKYFLLNAQSDKNQIEKILYDKNIFIDYFTKYQFLEKKYQGTILLGSEKSFGNFITHSKGAILSFKCDGCNNVKYSYELRNSTDCYDTYVWGENPINTYEGHCITGTDVKFCNVIWGGNNIYFCDNILEYSSNIFGCIGLRNKSYCIFNKQYTKEEYEIQVAKIITHMQTTGERGEFFHPSLSPFGYNETVAQEYYPLEFDGINLNSIEQTSPSARSAPCHLSLSGETKQGGNNIANTTGFVPPDKEGGLGQGPRTGGLQKQGYHRSTYNADPSIPEGVQTIERKNYSDEQRNSLLQEDNLETKVFLCSVSARPYRLQKAEIEFYRKHQLPIPDKHPDIRHEERMKLRPGRTLFLRTCDCCGKEMLSVYPPEYEGKVYCEECYTKEVYS